MSIVDTVTAWAGDKLQAAETAAADGAAWATQKLQAAGSAAADGLSWAWSMDKAMLPTSLGASLGETVREYAGPAVSSVAASVSDAVAAVNPFSSSSSDPAALPLWLKFTVVGAVLIGTAVFFNGLAHHE